MAEIDVRRDGAAREAPLVASSRADSADCSGLASLSGDTGGPDKFAKSTVSRGQLTINIICVGLGTGMFSLPATMAGCSVITGSLIMFAAVWLNVMTIMILVRAAEAHQVFELGALMALLPGPLLPGRLGRSLPSYGSFMQALMNVTVWVAVFGCLISYFIVMHNSALPFVKNTWLDQGRVPLVSISALIVLSLSFLEQRRLSWTSTISTMVNVFLVVVLCIEYGRKVVDDSLPSGVCYLGIGRGAFSMLAAFAKCVAFQFAILPMYQQLQDRSPARFAPCIWCACGALAVIFSSFASLGYMAFGPEVDGDILVSFGRGHLADFAQIGTVLIAAAIYPLLVIPMVAPVRNMELPGALRGRRGLLVTATTVAVVLISYLGALFMKDLKDVNVVCGALMVGGFMALAPGSAGLHLLNKTGLVWKFLMYALFVLGGVSMVLGVVMDNSYLSDMKANCLLKA